jgi:hypothetical protein
MRTFTTILILLGVAGAFSCGLVSWMTYASYQHAEYLRQYGHYLDVEIVNKNVASATDDSENFYYINVQSVNHTLGSPIYQSRVDSITYQELFIGQKLKAWVFGTETLLDYGPQNDKFVARAMLVTCLGFILLTIAATSYKVIRLARLPARH